MINNLKFFWDLFSLQLLSAVSVSLSLVSVQFILSRSKRTGPDFHLMNTFWFLLQFDLCSFIIDTFYFMFYYFAGLMIEKRGIELDHALAHHLIQRGMQA